MHRRIISTRYDLCRVLTGRPRAYEIGLEEYPDLGKAHPQLAVLLLLSVRVWRELSVFSQGFAMEGGTANERAPDRGWTDSHRGLQITTQLAHFDPGHTTHPNLDLAKPRNESGSSGNISSSRVATQALKRKPQTTWERFRIFRQVEAGISARSLEEGGGFQRGRRGEARKVKLWRCCGKAQEA